MKSDIQGIVGRVARIRELANAVIERELASRRLEGLQPAHGSVLAFLFGQQKPVPVKEIVERVGRVKSTVTGMVNTLERHGYVRKTPSAEDGRVVYVELTQKGDALRAEFEAISQTLLDAVYGKMTRGDRKMLVQLLSQVESNLRENAGQERV
jgi:DNA-binding MarR family transcriptional regulator